MAKLKFCSVLGCNKPSRTRGMCKNHFAVWWRQNGTTPCSVEGCARSSELRGYCLKHYSRWSRYGDPLITRHRSPGSSGGIGTAGYKLLNGKNEHVQIAERAVGKNLPKGAHVHHVDYDKLNNANTNLVVCPNTSYHRLLHVRTDALNACGNPDWRRCKFCQRYGDPAAMYGYPGGVMFHHRECMNEYERNRKAARIAREDAATCS